MQRIQMDTGKGMITYDEYGSRSAPAVLLLHGAAALDTFCGQYGFADSYHLIVPHLRGAGEAAGTAYDPEEMKRELLCLIQALCREKIGVIGHSLGAQLAVMLICEKPELFSFGIFLSAWVNPKPETVSRYLRLAALSSHALKWGWLVRLQGKYWHYTEQQAAYMEEYAKKITPQVYRSFFSNTLDLAKLDGYTSVEVPMLAVCGSREVKDMKVSLKLLGQNPRCCTILLAKADHDFPMRNAELLNPILLKFIEENFSQKKL